MASGLSPHNEQYLDQVVAGGLYPSKDAALDAAVIALREKHSAIPVVPPEHLALVEEALEDIEKHGSVEMTAEDWTRLRQLARDTATGQV